MQDSVHKLAQFLKDFWFSRTPYQMSQIIYPLSMALPYFSDFQQISCKLSMVFQRFLIKYNLVSWAKKIEASLMTKSK